MPKAAHKVEVRIDAREATLIAAFQAIFPEGCPEITWTKNLALADIQVLVDGVTALVIERKRNDDFRSAVGNGRFRRQRTAMILARQRQPGLLLMYVFEGSVDSLDYHPQSKITPQFLHQLQRELTYKYNIITKEFAGYSDTIRLIGHVIDCYQKYGAPADILSAVTPLDAETAGRKKLQPTPELDVEKTMQPSFHPSDFLRIALECIRGMTPTKAQTVMEHYATLPVLIAAYQGLKTEKSRCLMLAKLKAQGESRKFGPQLSGRVYACLFGVKEQDFKKSVIELDV